MEGIRASARRALTDDECLKKLIKILFRVKSDTFLINEINAELSREKLLSAVDRVSTIANEKSPVVKFKLLENILNLNTINNESSTASEDLKINYIGDEIEIGFNSKYIMDIVNNLEDSEISINLKDNTSPITAQ